MVAREGATLDQRLCGFGFIKNFNMYVCMYACMYVCMYACMHACMHVCTYVLTYVHTYVRMYVYCMYIVCMYEIEGIIEKCFPLRKQGKRSRKKSLSNEAIRNIACKQMLWGYINTLEM